MRAVNGYAGPRRVVFVGPVGVGKSTAVRAVSRTPVITEDDIGASPAPAGTRAARRLDGAAGLDRGEWIAPDGTKIAVVSTPGQSRLRSAWQSGPTGNTTIVLWLNGQNSYALEECIEWMNFIGDPKIWPKLTVAVTRLNDRTPGPPLNAYRAVLDRYSRRIRLLAADPRDGEQVGQVLHSALRLTERSIAS